MANKVTVNQFLNAFYDQWEEENSEAGQSVSKLYAGPSKPWTNFILNSNGFIDRVVKRFNGSLIRKPEWWRIDLAYIGGDTSAADSRGYLLDLQILIEHENFDDPEEEMYNLIFFRSPLKVIIFRDYNLEKRGRNKDYNDWLGKKLDEFMSMLKIANAYHAEDLSTRYLFIIWASEFKGGPVSWRWATDQSISPQIWNSD